MPAETHIEARVESLNAVLTEKHGQAVGKALRAANGDMPAALTSLKGKLPEAALKKVALAPSLMVWSDDHVSLVKALLGQAVIESMLRKEGVETRLFPYAGASLGLIGSDLPNQNTRDLSKTRTPATFQAHL